MVILSFATEKKDPVELKFTTGADLVPLAFTVSDSDKVPLAFTTRPEFIVLAFRTAFKVEHVDLHPVISDDCKTVTLTLPELLEDITYTAEVINLMHDTKVDVTLNLEAGTAVFTTEIDSIFSFALYGDGDIVVDTYVPVLCRSRKCANKANLKDIRNFKKCKGKYSSRLVDLFIRGIEANVLTGDIDTAFELLEAVNDICSNNCQDCVC